MGIVPQTRASGPFWGVETTMGTTYITTLEALIEALISISDDYGPNINVTIDTPESDAPHISRVGVGTDSDGSPIAILYAEHNDDAESTAR